MNGLRGNWPKENCLGVNNSISNPLNIKYRVPQEPYLGVILFLVYINDLCDAKLYSCITAFAEDKSLTYCVKQSLSACLFIPLKDERTALGGNSYFLQLSKSHGLRVN